MSIVERKSHQNISYVERERIKNRQKIICSYNFVQYCTFESMLMPTYALYYFDLFLSRHICYISLSEYLLYIIYHDITYYKKDVRKKHKCHYLSY